MVDDLINDFIEYAKEKFDCEVKVKLSDEPDTFEGIFGTSFIGDADYDQEQDGRWQK